MNWGQNSSYVFMRRSRCLVGEKPLEQGEQVEPLQHQPPEREVGIAGEAVSVAQDDAGPGRVAVANDAYRRAVVHRKVERCGGFGQHEPGRPQSGLDAGSRRTVHPTTTPAAGMATIGSRPRYVKFSPTDWSAFQRRWFMSRISVMSSPNVDNSSEPRHAQAVVAGITP